jgi:site-specific DNA-methyltransferase (adenine-specific)
LGGSSSLNYVSAMGDAEVSLPKPYYEEGGIVIYHADCRDILPHLPKVDLVLTDPPYGINWNCDYSSWLNGKNIKYPTTRSYAPVHGDDKPFDPTFLLDYKNIILWGANCYPNHLSAGSFLIWHKRTSGFLADAEAAWMNRGTGVYVFSETVESMQSERLHPTQKPVNLFKWCIERSNTTGTVLDPFMGSGTTLRAAKDLGRKAIGIEIEEKYCEIAVKRLAQEVLPL